MEGLHYKLLNATDTLPGGMPNHASFMNFISLRGGHEQVKQPWPLFLLQTFWFVIAEKIEVEVITLSMIQLDVSVPEGP